MTLIAWQGNICQKKLQKWSVKVLCLENSKSQFVYDFDIYVGKNSCNMERATCKSCELQSTHLMVTRLMDGKNRKGHVVVMDNYFSSVGLFKELAKNKHIALGH